MIWTQAHTPGQRRSLPTTWHDISGNDSASPKPGYWTHPLKPSPELEKTRTSGSG
jgi:hypothetical protein